MAYSNAFSATDISVRPPGSGGRLRFAHRETGRHGLLRRALSGALPEAALPAWRGARGGGDESWGDKCWIQILYILYVLYLKGYRNS